MTLAQERLAAFVAWLNESSASDKAPNGRDTIVRGPYALVVPADLSQPPGSSFAPEHLPLWTPAQQAVPGLPSITADPPPCQPRVADRLRHIIWMFEQGRFAGAILSLTDPGEPLQAVMARQASALDLATHPVLFAPLWDLDADTRDLLDRHLPLIRG